MQLQPFGTFPLKNASFELETSNQWVFFKLILYWYSRTPNHFFEFLVSVINHYHINGLHLFWDSFEWFCFQISSNAKYFFLYCPRHCDRGLIFVKVYYFQVWNKKNKKNTRLLVVELLAVTGALCILRHPIYFYSLSCLNFWDKACWFLLLRFFGLLSSCLLLFLQWNSTWPSLAVVVKYTRVRQVGH